VSARSLPAADPAVLQQAAHWLSVLASGAASADERAAHDAWRAADPRHEAAWQNASRLMNQLQALPVPLAGPVLGRRRLSRRAALGTLLGAAVATPFALQLHRYASGGYRTARGGSQWVRLDDGSLLRLDTATLLRPGPGARRLALEEGRILLQCAAAQAVHTVHAQLQVPAGAVAIIEARPQYTCVAVTRGQLHLHPCAGGASTIVSAGQRSVVAAAGVTAPAPIQADDTAWIDGLLHADNERLDAFLLRLSRYRNGWLDCDVASAGRRISGVFRLEDPVQVVDVVARTLQLQVRRWGPWIRLQG